MLIDRDTIIDLVALVDTQYMKLKVGTYNAFDMYETFALYIEAIARDDEREAIAEMVSNCSTRATPKGIAAAIRTGRKK